MGQMVSNWDLDEIEAELRSRGWSEIVRRRLVRNPRDRYLFARAALASSSPMHMSDALQVLGESQDISSVGMRAALLAQMREPELILQLELPGTPRRIVEIDGAVWFHFARGIALSEVGRHTDALVAMGAAKAFNGMIGMASREQLLDMHIQAYQNQLGRTDVEAIERTLRLPMPEGRRAWATNNYVAGLLQLGDYEQAYKVAPEGSYWQAMAGALAGKISDVTTEGPFYEAARAWVELQAFRDVPLVSGLRNGIIREYAKLAAAAHLARSAATAQHAPRILGSEPPERADQAAMWAVIMLQAQARGATTPDPLSMPSILTEALGDLRNTFDVLRVLEAVAPEGLLIAAYGPRALSDVVHVRLAAVKRSLVQLNAGAFLKGYRHEEYQVARHANLGSVLAGIEIMINTAMDERRSGLLHQWNRAHSEALWDLTPNLRTALQTQDPHCTPVNGERSLSA